MATRMEEVSKLCVEPALDVIGREFGELGRVPACIKCLRYAQRDGLDLISEIEDLHPFLENRSSISRVECLTMNLK